MRANDLRAITSRKATGGKDTWRTPSVVLDLVREVAGCQIGIDPCTDDSNPTVARVCVCPPNDGLLVQWSGHGMCFVNPPYSTNELWMRKCREESARLRVADQLVALVPARTSNKWWHEHAIRAVAVCFWKGRIKFVDPDKNTENCATFPSALLYWGNRADEFKRVFGRRGWCVTP